jgi:hypothetical protein
LKVMQPTAVNPHFLVFWVTAIMTGKATEKEQELQGSSGGHASVAGRAKFIGQAFAADAADAADAGGTT